MDIGQRLFSDLSAALKGGGEINVSLAGIDRLASAFLRHGVCPLVKQLGWDEFQRRVHLVDATEVQAIIWNNTMTRARSYYASPDVYRLLDQQMLEGDIG
jgi:hypothetical protein